MVERERWYQHPVNIVAMQAGVVLLLLLSWELASGRLVPAFFTSKPSLVLPTIGRWLQTGFIWEHVLYTTQATVLGFLLGAAGGIVVGLLLGLYENAARVLNPYLTALYSIPKIALAPLFVLWFGLDLAPKVYMAAFIVFFLVFLNAYAGVTNVDPELLEALRLMGASRADELRYVILPATATWIFAGLKTSFPYALHGAVIGEIISSTRGLGYLTMWAKGTYNMTNMFAALVTLMIVAVVLNVGLEWLERRLLRWRVVSR
ncbi:MAG: ABC transporter permease [Chloroflexi bacterium]|nr:ABC transporter permease [Chloroflexota bacterium]